MPRLGAPGWAGEKSGIFVHPTRGTPPIPHAWNVEIHAYQEYFRTSQREKKLVAYRARERILSGLRRMMVSLRFEPVEIISMGHSERSSRN